MRVWTDAARYQHRNRLTCNVFCDVPRDGKPDHKVCELEGDSVQSGRWFIRDRTLAAVWWLEDRYHLHGLVASIKDRLQNDAERRQRVKHRRTNNPLKRDRKLAL